MSEDGGAIWERLITGDETNDYFVANSIVFDPGVLATLHAAGYCMDQRGDAMAVATFSAVNPNWAVTEMPTTACDVGRLNDVAVSGTNPDIRYAGGSCEYDLVVHPAFFKSVDGGDTWQDFSAYVAAGGTTIRKIAVAPDNADLVYIMKDTGFYRSEDGGTSWQSGGHGALLDFELDPNEPGFVWVGNRNGMVFLSRDAAQTWEFVGYGLQALPVYDLAINPQFSPLVYAGSGTGVYRLLLDDHPQPVFLASFVARRHGTAVMLRWEVAADAGSAPFTVWRETVSGGRVRISDAPVLGNGRYEFLDREAPTHRVSYWLQRTGGADGVDDADWFGPAIASAASLRFALAPSCPNPFNAATTISFTLAEREPVSLRIYDAAGRLVATLVDAQVTAAGTHTLSWDARNDAGVPVSSGAYFCRLDNERQQAIQSMILIK